MSEFKYACPVCGQHIKCDSSQVGTVMDCPTCFQKIIVPQAPASADQVLILTGTKFEDRKSTNHLAGASNVAKAAAPRASAGSKPGAATGDKGAAPEKKSSTPLIAVVVLLLLALGAGAFIFRDKLFSGASGWQSSDIGSVKVPGAFAKAGTVWTVTGAGGDIWDQADAFRFVYQEAYGDAVMTVQVTDIQNTHPWAKAGLMVRDSLDANASYALIFVSPVSGIAFQQRSGNGTVAANIANASGKAPWWLRLTRAGDTFKAETSGDGVTWNKTGSTKIAMKSPVYLGLVVCSHKDGALCQATFDHLTVDNAMPKSPPPAPTTVATANPATPPAKVAPPPKVAPPANDDNWTLELDGAKIPKATAAGRIHGQEFIVDHATFQGSTLTLRQGNHGAVDFGVTIDFEGAQAESLADQVINISTNADKAARVTLHWKVNDRPYKDGYNNGYAMRLEFGTLAKNRLPGKIYLCTPDSEKTYLMGRFSAIIPQPKPKK